MKSLNINDLKNMRIDYSNVVNHTLDVSSNSILSINNGNKEKLNNYINSVIRSGDKTIFITIYNNQNQKRSIGIKIE